VRSAFSAFSSWSNLFLLRTPERSGSMALVQRIIVLGVGAFHKNQKPTTMGDDESEYKVKYLDGDEEEEELVSLYEPC
jgi:hypothetical protein